MINKVIGKYNLYERNVYKFWLKNTDKLFVREWLAAIWTQINKFFLHRLYFNYIELPITTKCSLRCKECSNLIQYYQQGKFFDYKKIITDIHRLCQVSEKIEMLRILGGEPLLHPYLKEIIEGILENKNINNIQIVTNGTLLFKKEIIRVLRNDRVSVDISNYNDVSKNYNNLIKQLRTNRIKFITNRELKWTEQSDFTFQNRSLKEMEQILKDCKLDCISLLNGELHLCPRSSNGNDLRIFNADVSDYVNLRGRKTKKKVKLEIFNLLNKKSIVACNYCNVYMWEKLRPCIAGEQTSIKEAMKKYNTIMCVNNGGKNESDCMGGRKGVC